MDTSGHSNAEKYKKSVHDNSETNCLQYSRLSAVSKFHPQFSLNREVVEKIEYSGTTCDLGRLLVARSSRGICQIAMGDQEDELVDALRSNFSNAELSRVGRANVPQVEAIAAMVQQPSRSHEVLLDVRGTAFQRKIWRALQQVPAGQTMTYSQLAAKVGRPDACRAVASACGANRLAIMIPCHRIIRQDGSLGGYRWGVGRKRRLLEWESKIALSL